MSAYNDDKIYSVDLVGAVGFSSFFFPFFKLKFIFGRYFVKEHLFSRWLT